MKVSTSLPLEMLSEMAASFAMQQTGFEVGLTHESVEIKDGEFRFTFDVPDVEVEKEVSSEWIEKYADENGNIEISEDMENEPMTKLIQNFEKDFPNGIEL